MRVDTVEEALKDVDWYADHGYVQIKIYSSIKPELMPVIADRAHARGLRVSGHVPAFMSAQQFVEGGADEIQHINFVELNFLYPRVQGDAQMRALHRGRRARARVHAGQPAGARLHRVPEASPHRARSHAEHVRGALLRRSRQRRHRDCEDVARDFRRRSAGHSSAARSRCRRARRRRIAKRSRRCCVC